MKTFGLIAACLLLFVLNCSMGCGTKVIERSPAVVDCSEPYFLDDFRCQVYMPDEGVELDDFEDVEGH